MTQPSALMFWALLAFMAHGFVIQDSSTTVARSTKLYNKPSNVAVPEYLFEDTEDEGQQRELVDYSIRPDKYVPRKESPSSSRSETPQQPLRDTMTSDATSSGSASTSPAFFSALSPGTVVQIQVPTDAMSKARKAWKKRRRSGSPLLVPCSILSVDRLACLRWNCLYLLNKFGQVPAKNGGTFVELNLEQLSQRHKSHLKQSLQSQATLLGFDDVRSLVTDLFSKQVQDTYGVKLVEKGDDLLLQAASSKMRSQKRAMAAAIVQVQEGLDGSDSSLEHTGMVRVRNPQDSANYYSIQPLSAALRINPINKSNNETFETAAIENGSVQSAIVFDYDPVGDAGMPLMTLALNPARVRDRLKMSINPAKRDESIIEGSNYKLDELSVGMQLEGRVGRLVKGGALIDCGVIRSRKDKSVAKCWGRLNFRDAVSPDSAQERMDGGMYEDDYDEEDEDDEMYDDEEDLDDILGQLDLNNIDLEGDEESEDITHLFEQNEDGSLTYNNPETGESELISTDIDDDDDDASEDITHLFEHAPDGSLLYEDPKTGKKHHVYTDGDSGDITDLFVQHDDGSLTYNGSEDEIDDFDEDDNERFPIIDESELVEARGFQSVLTQAQRRPQLLKVDDVIAVYVKSVSRNSGQLSLTMDPSVQGKSAQDLKRESGVSKRLSRLSKQLGGMKRMKQLLGKECNGIVKAVSNAGDWFYVEPELDNVPVGVASVSEEIRESLARGDGVRIQIVGVDEERGQLAMRILQRVEAPVIA
jgi:hypothetical protein